MEKQIDFKVIRALDGWSVATFFEKEEEFGFEPIIAWAIKVMSDSGGVYVDVEPVTVEGVMSIANFWCIRQPDGKFVRQGDWGPCAEEMALLSAREEIARRAAEALAKKAKA